MANRSYPSFGKVKTIVLPIPTARLTYQEYKEKYGIELKEFFELKDDTIQPKSMRNSFIIFDITDLKENGSGMDTLMNLVSACSLPVNEGFYSAGSNDAQLEYSILTYNSGDEVATKVAYVDLRISKNADYSFDNITIAGGEY